MVGSNETLISKGLRLFSFIILKIFFGSNETLISKGLRLKLLVFESVFHWFE